MDQAFVWSHVDQTSKQLFITKGPDAVLKWWSANVASIRWAWACDRYDMSILYECESCAVTFDAIFLLAGMAEAVKNLYGDCELQSGLAEMICWRASEHLERLRQKTCDQCGL